jgi:hypothetical protein
VPTVERFEELRVWQAAREIVTLVYRLTGGFPTHERYGLASQMQRAAVSTMSNVAEGFERGTTREFIYLKHTPFQGPKLRESGPVWTIDESET